MEYYYILGLIFYFTMVTAGVYLLLRLSLLISFSYYTILFITIIGSLTTFIGGLLALTSLDMKELIAYSTMSQLGYRYYSKKFYVGKTKNPWFINYFNKTYLNNKKMSICNALLKYGHNSFLYFRNISFYYY